MADMIPFRSLVGVLEVVEDVGLELLRLLVVVVVVRASDCLKGLSAEGKRQHWLDMAMV
jgi:hypothetical protein